MNLRKTQQPLLTGTVQRLFLARKTIELLRKPADPVIVKESRKKAESLIVRLRKEAAAKRSPEIAGAVASMVKRRTEVKVRLKAMVAARSKRTPNAIIAGFVSRLSVPRKTGGKIVSPASLIIRSRKLNVHTFSETLANILGDGRPADLNALGISVRMIPLKRAERTAFSVRFAVEHSSIRTELMNLAWALRRTGAFDSVAVSGLTGALFAVRPSAATHAERNFAWHLDLTRVTRAQELNPQGGGRRLGEGIVIAHPDTGWAPHEQYNGDFVDKARSHNVITGRTGDDAALHSLRNGDAYAPNITHGTATGSVILGGRPGDGEELSSTRLESSLEFSTGLDGRRQYVGVGLRTVFDRKGHLTGVAPKATVLPIKFISDQALTEITERGLEGVGVFRIFDDDLVSAIRYAIDEQVHVVSLSVGGLMHDEVRQVLDEAILDNNIIVVAAAGQTYAANFVSGAADAAATVGLVADDSVVLPAAYTNVIAVAGCAPDGAPWIESHYGPNVDITAPADAIWIADFDPKDDRSDDATRRERLNCASGTSFAASFTAGVAALWLAHWGRQNLIDRYGPSEISLAWVFRHQLQMTATAAHTDDWDDGRYGPGVINVEALLRRPLPDPSDVEAPPVMVNGLVPAVSGGSEAAYDVGIEFMDWLGEQTRAGERTIATGLVIAERAVEEGLNILGDMWAQADAAARGLVGAALQEAENVKSGIEQAITEAVNAGEKIVEEKAEAAEDVWEEIEEGVEEFIDNVGEAGEDVVDAVVGWFSA
jgi:subtilisin family serine protease